MKYFMPGQKKKIHKEEHEIIKWARESVVSTSEIRKDEILNEKNLSVKRPAPNKNEIPARDFFKILGKKATKKIKKDKKIKWNQIK